MTGLVAEITEALASVTDEEVTDVRRRLSEAKEDERVLAMVSDPEARRLWALAERYDRLSGLAGHAARFDVIAEARPDLMAQCARLASLGSIARELAWRRIQDILGREAGEAKSLGLRAGFTVVICKDVPEQFHHLPPPEVLQAMIEDLRATLASQLEERPRRPRKAAKPQ